MTLLRDLSGIWVMIHTLIIFVFLFEPRYSRKKTCIITISTMLPICILNFALFLFIGAEKFGQVLLLTCTLPSLVGFWFLAKHRDGRFFFTFCLSDTISLEIVYLTNILDYYLTGESYVLMFVLRLLAYPLVEWLFYKKLRPMYLDVQRHISKGCYTFAGIGAIFYVSITLLMCYPTLITQRPAYLPAFLLLLLLMPILYIHILNTLRYQQRLHEFSVNESILRFQTANLKSRLLEYRTADEKFRLERHDFRHMMQTITALAENGQQAELLALVREYSKSVEDAQVKRYCSNAVIDATLSSYIHQAESREIQVSARVALPEVLPASEIELATVFANAIENAIHACEKLEAHARSIEVQALVEPRFMFQVSNSFDGDIEFNEAGVPISRQQGHGLGTRSIVAFCEKHGAYYEFKADGNRFCLRIVF